MWRSFCGSFSINNINSFMSTKYTREVKLRNVRFSSCIQNKWTSILYLLLELIRGFGRSISWVQCIGHSMYKMWCWSSFLAWNTFGELSFALFCTIIRWSVGHDLLRSEVAQAFAPHRNRQKLSFCHITAVSGCDRIYRELSRSLLWHMNHWGGLYEHFRNCSVTGELLTFPLQ